MKRTHSISSPLSFFENGTLSPLSLSSVLPKKAIMVLRLNKKREFAYQTFIETIAGNHSECELKAVMDYIHYDLFEASKEKDYRLSPVSRYLVSINNG